MTDLSAVRSALADLAKGPPVVAAFVGGTTGIGKYTAQALARSFSGQGEKLRVYIIGRNVSRAEELIAECTQVAPGSNWRFVRAKDLSEIGEVDHACKEVVSQEEEEVDKGDTPKRLDLLYLSAGPPILGKTFQTKEGLDMFTSLLYYTRMRFIMQLSPLLLASPSPHVVSIYAGGLEGKLSPGESPIGPPGPSGSLTQLRKNVTYMTTLFFEELAEKYNGRVSMSHVFPGLVFGPTFTSKEMPLWFRILWTVLTPITRLMAVPEAECGERMLYLSTSRFPPRGARKPDGAADSKIEMAESTLGQIGGGTYSVGKKGEINDIEKNFGYSKLRADGLGKRVWEHTIEILARPEKSV